MGQAGPAFEHGLGFGALGALGTWAAGDSRCIVDVVLDTVSLVVGHYWCVHCNGNERLKKVLKST